MNVLNFGQFCPPHFIPEFRTSPSTMHWHVDHGGGAVAEVRRQVERTFSITTFRSSSNLKHGLRFIVESCVMPSIKYAWGRQSYNFNTRLSALMKLAVSYLTVPTMSTLFGFGLAPPAAADGATGDLELDQLLQQTSSMCDDLSMCSDFKIYLTSWMQGG